MQVLSHYSRYLTKKAINDRLLVMKKILYITAIVFVLALIIIGIYAATSKHGGSVGSTNATSTVPETVATVAIQSISHSANTASALSALSNTVHWATDGYPANAGVNVNLIRKISDSPVQYTIVRQLATNIPNTGQYTWVSHSGETGSDLYVEVTCSSNNLTQGCQVSATPLSAN